MSTVFLILPTANATPSPKVTICHATGSSSNPYVTVTVNSSSIDEPNNSDLNGHGNHAADIIPPFSSPEGNSFPGLNWGAEGQAIWNAGCVVPAPVTTSPAPETTTPEPETTTPEPETTTPEPETTTPEPETTTPEPETTTPEPVTTSPAPVTTSPAPVTTTPAPAKTSAGQHPMSVSAGGGPMDPGSKPLWLWMVPLALLGLMVASLRQSMVAARR